jgi:hypothetical protein
VENFQRGMEELTCKEVLGSTKVLASQSNIKVVGVFSQLLSMKLKFVTKVPIQN